MGGRRPRLRLRSVRLAYFLVPGQESDVIKIPKTTPERRFIVLNVSGSITVYWLLIMYIISISGRELPYYRIYTGTTMYF